MKKFIAVVLTMLAAVSYSELVHYIELEFSQSSFTLDIGQHIKDASNKFSITFPTTKEFYDSVKEGETIGSKFKSASFIFNGNLGKRKVVVTRKFIKDETKKVVPVEKSNVESKAKKDSSNDNAVQTGLCVFVAVLSMFIILSFIGFFKMIKKY